MSVFPQLERLLWLHQQIKTQRYPNAVRLAERFEVSDKTAQRDINCLRDRFRAPLSFSRNRNGYFYEDTFYELPCLPASQQEVLCLLMARRLLDQAAGGYIGRELGSLKEKVFAAECSLGFTPDIVQSTFSAVWSGYTPAQEENFRLTAWALIHRRPIRFNYHSPISEQITNRVVEPHHLQHYMASWVLTAFCRNRNAWRKFYLARMSGLQILDSAFTPRPECEWRPLLEDAFGLFHGDETTDVTLRFSAFRARWVREQIWHPAQQMIECSDGGLDLILPVADFREIKMRILQFGADCEVVAPAALREEVRLEIERMGDVYR
ncbi:MAG: WYL domain-containing protein [Desulfobacteraceae bacterium]|nr:MAG: WYL domain-containing protein [Desulfobacteraceae bacterium]